nr:MAG: ORF1 [Torque teno midi virus]
MPFWWGRRRKFWYGTRYKRWGRRKPKYKTRRKTRRRRYRRAPRRRRRRRRKVRRKKPNLILRQWQPDSIVLCKIKGFSSIIWGAEGSQYLSATNNMFEYTRSKYPGGGCFATQTFSLKFLYDQWKLKNNIWTKSNQMKDLCRYLKSYHTFYRHPNVDFVIVYERQPPFNLDKLTYSQYHPYILLQRKHKIVLPSYNTNPRGKYKKRRVIKPPKQMLSKWFFSEQFSNYDLLLIIASACSLRYPTIGCCNENRMITVYCLNTKLFQETDWGQAKSGASFYKPFSTYSENVYFWSGSYNNPTKYNPVNEIKKGTSESSVYYYNSINKDIGYFTTRVLKAWKTTIGPDGAITKPLPLVLGRYNPAVDDGKGNVVFLQSIIGGHWNIPTKTDDWKIEGLPLWQAFWGYWDFLEQKYTKSIFTSHMFVIKSPYIQTSQTELEQTYWAFIDPQWIDGKNQYDSPITYTETKLWYPTCEAQTKTVNAFCTHFILNGGAHRCQTSQSMIQLKNKNMMFPIQSKRQYRYLIPQKTLQPQCSMTGTTDTGALQQQLLKECKATSKLIHLSNLIQTQNQHTKKEEPCHSYTTHKRKRKRSRNVSSLSAKKVHAKSHKRRKISSSSSSSSSNSSSNSSTTS